MLIAWSQRRTLALDIVNFSSCDDMRLIHFEVNDANAFDYVIEPQRHTED
jgi:hypothetical protein